MLPRHRLGPQVGCGSGPSRASRWEAAGAGGGENGPPGEHRRSGVERAPNPVASCVCGTWQSRWGPTSPVAVVGGLTVREAEIPSGRRMTREANAGGRKATGNRGSRTSLPLVAADNRPDRDHVLTRKGADAGRVSL
jgi:hypothetical protein